jgi:hypothetical protein
MNYLNALLLAAYPTKNFILGEIAVLSSSLISHRRLNIT